jgi:hypothetical protein
MWLTRRGPALVGAAWLAMGGAAAAAEPKPAESRDARQKEVALGDLRIAIDPKTGELRPLTPGEAKKLQDAMRKRFPAREIELTQRPDGALSSVVAPNVLAFSVARIGAGGKVERSCVAGPEEALALLRSAARRPAGPEEK